MQAADVTSQDSRARHLTDASRPYGNLSTKLDASGHLVLAYYHYRLQPYSSQRPRNATEVMSDSERRWTAQRIRHETGSGHFTSRFWTPSTFLSIMRSNSSILNTVIQTPCIYTVVWGYCDGSRMHEI